MQRQLMALVMGLIGLALLAGCSTVQQPISGKSWSQRAAEEERAEPFHSPDGSDLGRQ